MDAIYIKKGFEAYIREKTVNPKHAEQRSFLLNHERRHIAEKNVLMEIKNTSMRWGARFQKKHVDMLILAGAQVFCDCALAAKIKELMTEAELKRQIQNAEENRIKDAEDMVQQMEKEVLSTAITKSMLVGNVGNQEKETLSQAARFEDEHRLDDSGIYGASLLSPGGDSACIGVDASPVSTSD